MNGLGSGLDTNNGTNNASTLYRARSMKTTELPLSTHDDTDQSLLDRTVGNGDAGRSNDLTGGADCSLDESVPVFDSTLIEAPFSAVGEEDEEYANGGLSSVPICTWVTFLQGCKVSLADELSDCY